MMTVALEVLVRFLWSTVHPGFNWFFCLWGLFLLPGNIVRYILLCYHCILDLE